MATVAKDSRRTLPATPWGLLPPRMRVLYVSAPRRTGAWLADAFAGDSACQVILEEVCGATAGLARLRDEVFDALLVSHEPGELDALELVDGLRAGGAEEPLIILGQVSEQEMSALAYEVGADAYVCANTATTRTLLWIVARAIEHRHLIRENRRLVRAERHRFEQEQHEAQRLLTEQRDLVRWPRGSSDGMALDETSEAAGAPRGASNERGRAAETPSLAEPLPTHYRQMLRAHVMMGSGNLAAEMAVLAPMLAAAAVTPREAMNLHVQALEELVRGLGNRSARHVMTRADLLLVEVLVELAECYRLRALAAAQQPPSHPVP